MPDISLHHSLVIPKRFIAHITIPCRKSIAAQCELNHASGIQVRNHFFFLLNIHPCHYVLFDCSKNSIYAPLLLTVRRLTDCTSKSS